MGHAVRFGDVWMSVEPDQGRRGGLVLGDRRRRRGRLSTRKCAFPPDISDPATPMPLRPLTWAFTLGSARARSGRDHLGAQFVRWPL
jgi:hypothetical protein